MHPAQWVFRQVVVEFRNRANRLPRVGGVAVLAGHAQVAMRTVRAFCILCARHAGSGGKHQKKQSNCRTGSLRPHGLVPCGRSLRHAKNPVRRAISRRAIPSPSESIALSARPYIALVQTCTEFRGKAHVSAVPGAVYFVAFFAVMVEKTEHASKSKWRHSDH